MHSLFVLIDSLLVGAHATFFLLIGEICPLILALDFGPKNWNRNWIISIKNILNSSLLRRFWIYLCWRGFGLSLFKRFWIITVQEIWVSAMAVYFGNIWQHLVFDKSVNLSRGFLIISLVLIAELGPHGHCGRGGKKIEKYLFWRLFFMLNLKSRWSLLIKFVTQFISTLKKFKFVTNSFLTTRPMKHWSYGNYLTLSIIQIPIKFYVWAWTLCNRVSYMYMYMYVSTTISPRRKGWRTLGAISPFVLLFNLVNFLSLPVIFSSKGFPRQILHALWVLHSLLIRLLFNF